MEEFLPTCPNCRHQCIQRVYGVWCTRCRGWYVVARKPGGEALPYIRSFRYLP